MPNKISVGSTGRSRTGSRCLFMIALAAALSLLLASPAAAEPAAPGLPDVSTAGAQTDTYIVALADAPVAAYDGGVKSLQATRPADGDRVNLTSVKAKRYRHYLRERQDLVAARVGSSPKERFEVGLAGFTATLTAQQAATLAKTDHVVSVTPDTLRPPPDDRKSTDFLGLSGPAGVWSQLGGTRKAGRGVVVGVIDSGIWPESESFAGASLTPDPNGRAGRFNPHVHGDKISMTKSDGGEFVGTCQAGEQFKATDCNSKLVGARYFVDTWLARNPGDRPTDYLSPRDGEGHGSHVASVAAGNSGVRAVAGGTDFGSISGVAPAAKIAAYKVIWQGKSAAQTGAYDSDIVAAIEAAISDGVDVINFSISANDNPNSPVQLAFLAAARAGIFVAAAAGNSGPGASTVQSTAPWVTTVGAHTIAPYYGTVTLGDGRSYAGISTTVNRPVGPAPLVTSDRVAAAGQQPNAPVCAANSLDPNLATGKIVVCTRGVVDRIVKSAEVKRAGGIGMVLVNPAENTLDADLHSVPTVHVNPPAAADISGYAATDEATATLTEGNQSQTSISYPQLATFSGRGPSLGNGGDLLKPDLVAPGVSILGASAPASNNGSNFEFISGTSQAAPQVSGLAALWFGDGTHPHWSPMKVKSALMTTASDLSDADGHPATDPYGQGAGRVRPDQMFSPGLVYPAGDRDWLAYLAGLGVDTGVAVADPSDYNAPSIAIGKLAGKQTVQRRVKAVKPGRYRVQAAVAGAEVEVRPAVLNFSRRGQVKRFSVTVTRTTAALDQPASGFLTWQRQREQVRIPIVVTPRAVDAPLQLASSGGTRQLGYSVTPGTSGPFALAVTGLAIGTERPAVLPTGRNVQFAVPVQTGTKVARFTARTPNSAANLDLGVYRVLTPTSATLVASSATPAANESVVLHNPVAGTYVGLVVNSGNAPGTIETPVSFRAALARPGSGEGGFAADPSLVDATAGDRVPVRLSWAGLSDTDPYVGWVEYPNGQGTVVTVN